MKRALFLILFLMSLGMTKAQKTVYHDETHTVYRTAVELFSKEKYGAAKEQFARVLELEKDKNTETSALATYYQGICAAKLFNNDTEKLLKDYITQYPEHAHVNQAEFYLAGFYFSKKSYSKALKAFQEVDTRNLTADELAEYHYKTGYCYFIKENFDAASKAFFEIKDLDTKYKAPANYYYGHIAYVNDNMETALLSFNTLKEDPHFGPLIPYYTVHILYKQGRYKELLEQAKALLANTEEKKIPELSRIIGEAYYKTLKFGDALTYLETYAQKTTTPLERVDHYQLGYCYYRNAQFDKAIEHLSLAATEKDTLSQNSYFILADCYLQTKQVQFARNAFYDAYKLGLNPEITRPALLNYAKLSYELSFNPYNDAVVALMTYINDYPDAPDIDVANNLLVNVFFATKNYKEALSSIEKINFKTTELKSAHQKIAYYRGIELFNNRDYPNAIVHFNKSFDYILHPEEAALATYWKGEAFYRLNRYDSAAKCYNEFLLSPGAFQLPEYNRTQYNLGYTDFKQKNYTRAITSFRKFLSDKKEQNTVLISDANIRVGDCYFVTKNYTEALSYYNTAAEKGTGDADYAMYQKSICYGVLNKPENKAATLLDLLKKYPSSTYVIDAQFELANNYLVLGEDTKALTHFNAIVNDHTGSSYVVQAMLKAGLIHYNRSEYDEALRMLKKVVSDYPATTASKNALISIRDIYVNLNKTEEFFVYVKNIPFANVTQNEQDSITYIATQNQYMTGDCQNSVKGFTDYLDKFPEGAFVINATFYRAECLHKTGKLKEALKDYTFVVGKHTSLFSESALLKAAAINISLKKYEDAIPFYIQLENQADLKSNIVDARIGLMRAYYLTNDYNNAIETSQRLLTQEKLDENLNQEAHLTIGKAQLALKKVSFAQAEFLAVSRMGENAMKAEAKYNLALIQYDMGNYKESEKIIFEIINQMPSYDYWIAKSFILLADNLVKMDNIFQAKHTLQSIIDNYEGLDLVQIALEKLNKINEEEKLKIQNQVVPQDSIFEINY